jgi:choice-of-anchor C domain-containing protein
MKTLHYVLIAAFSLVLSSSAFALPFQNGSFEIGPNPGGYTTLYAGDTSITGWRVTQGSIDYIGSYWTASDGSRSLDLDGYFQQGGIEQAFDTVIGRKYLVSFDIAGNFDSGLNPKTMTVDVALSSGNYSFYKPVSWSHAGMGWLNYDFEFTAQASSSSLRFTSTTGSGNDAWGPALDNVSVESLPTPEPSSFLLIGSGLIGLVGFSRKFRK